MPRKRPPAFCSPTWPQPELRARLQAAGFAHCGRDASSAMGAGCMLIIVAEAGEMRLHAVRKPRSGRCCCRPRPGNAALHYAAFRLRVAGKALAGALGAGTARTAAFEVGKSPCGRRYPMATVRTDSGRLLEGIARVWKRRRSGITRACWPASPASGGTHACCARWI